MKVENIWGINRKEAFMRKKVTLAQAPKSAFLRIYVDTGYELWLNGRFVAHVDEWCNTRDYNVRLFLKAGENQIAVRAMNHSGHRGFALELVADAQTVAVSDASWKTLPQERWGWMLADFDDSGWDNALVQDMSAAGSPQWWTKPGSDPERVIPVMDCSQFFLGDIPKTCASPYWNAKSVTFTPDPEVVSLIGQEYADFAAAPHLLPVEQSVRLLNNSSPEQDGRVQLSAPERYTGPSLVVDFGKEIVGFFRLRVVSEKPVSFRFYYGETLDEAAGEPAREENLNRMLREEYRVREGVQEFEARMRVAFRYVRVEFYDCGAAVTADGFSARTALYPVARRGYFHCDDAELNQLWEMGERTQHFCMQEYYLDAPKRDRFLWTGDARMQALINYYTFGDTALFEFCWEELARLQYPNGGISSAYGEGCSMLWDYVAFYIIAFRDYYEYTGKLDFVLKLRATMERAVDYLTSLTDATGLIKVPENPLGKLWMVVLNSYVGYDAFLNELYLRCLQTAAFFATKAGDRTAAEKYERQIQKTAPALAELQPEKKLLREFETTSHSTLQYELGETELLGGDVPAMLRRIHTYWGSMTRSGADCLYEGTSAKERSAVEVQHEGEQGYGSLCHAWTAGPTVLLSKGVAGISPLTPGFETVRIQPQLGGLKEFCCVVPTPLGEIAVRAENNVLSYHLPAGMKGELMLNGITTEIGGNGKAKMN